MVRELTPEEQAELDRLAKEAQAKLDAERLARRKADADRAAIDTPRIQTQVAVERAKTRNGALILAPGTHYIESGAVMLAPGQSLIACEPPGVCSIQVPAGTGATWRVAPQKEWDDATLSKLP